RRFYMSVFRVSTLLNTNNPNYFLMYNIEQIRSLSKLSQDNFCTKEGETWAWKDYDEKLKENYSWSFETVCQLQLSCLHISPNTYNNYLKGNPPSETKLNQIVIDLNELRARIPELRDYIPEKITVESLTTVDLFKNDRRKIFEKK